MGKKTFLVIFGVLIFSQTAQADRVMPTPHVTSTFPDEIRLSSATMEMYGTLHRIVEEREKGNTSPEGLGKYTSAFEQLAQVPLRHPATTVATPVPPPPRRTHG